MKVAISCDSIISRDYTTSVVESVLSLYERAELYTIVHKAGKVLGPVEQRRIQSTYLSSLINDEFALGEDWWRKSFLIPGACRNLTIPCSVDVLINISSGFSQGFSKCDGVYQVTYLLENSIVNRKAKSFKERIFSGFVENWAIKQLKKSDELWVGNQVELEFWQKYHHKVSIMPPFFKASDYPLFPAAIRKTFPRDFLCFDSPSFTWTQAQTLIERCNTENIKFKFVGRDEHLLDKVDDKNKDHFFGERCSGELAPLLAASRGFISLQGLGFPSRLMNALSTGTPVALVENSEASAFFSDKEGIFQFSNFDELVISIKDIYSSMADLDPIQVHNQTNKYHDLKFRGELMRRMKEISHVVQEKRDKVNCSDR